MTGVQTCALPICVAENIPLPDKSIDIIVSNNGINNVSDISKTLKECSRVMKNGGQFVLTMNLDKTMFEFYQLLEQVLVEMGLTSNIDLIHQHIKQKRPPIDVIIRLLNQNGLRVRDLELDQFYYKFANGSAMLNHYFFRLAFLEAWIKLIPDQMVEEIFKRIENLLNIESEQTGLIKLSVPFVIINAEKLDYLSRPKK